MMLTNEEKKRIADSASLMMQRFCEFKMAEDRLSIMNELSGNVLKIAMDRELLNAALRPYIRRMQDAKKEFFEIIGIGEDNKEFWDWNLQEEKRRLQEEKCKNGGDTERA